MRHRPELYGVVGFVEFVECVTVVLIDHGHPAAESIPAPAFLAVNIDGVLAAIRWHLNRAVIRVGPLTRNHPCHGSSPFSPTAR